jgi:hypothetical protein
MRVMYIIHSTISFSVIHGHVTHKKIGYIHGRPCCLTVFVRLNQGFVFLPKLYQLVVRAHLDNLASVSLVFEYANVVSSFDGAEAMRNHNGGSLATTFLHQNIQTCLNNFFALIVQGGCRFI